MSHPERFNDNGRVDVTSRDRSAWVVSLVAHMLFLVVISLLSKHVRQTLPPIVLTSLPDEELPVEQVIPEAVHFDPLLQDQIGSRPVGGLETEAPGESVAIDRLQVPPLELEPQEQGEIDSRELVQAATGPTSDLNHAVKGAAGIAVTGAEGAIDRITHELLLSLDERQTLVVWFFDQSGSLQTQRADVSRRFQKVYDELGVIQASGSKAFDRHQDTPLLTSVVAFGSNVHFLIDEPTDNLSRIKHAVDEVELDDSGTERVFTAFQRAADRYKKYRSALDRNIVFVAFTDEAGDDQMALDRTVTICRRLSIPVYVIGVPAPFGRRETLVKWVDPDPRYDQATQWGRVEQGPESLQPERIRIQLNGFREDTAPIDSGFGPFALTRLCYETGGIYFTVHPNRKVRGTVNRRETAAYTAYFSAFFDPVVMRRYRPEYVSAQQYQQNLRNNPMRAALTRAAEISWLQPLESSRRRFVVRSEAQLARDLTEAQKDAARVVPTLKTMRDILMAGNDARQREIVPRWQAGYDLALGRVIANQVRAESYNSMLAQAKRGMQFSDAKNNTWRLRPTNEIENDSRLQHDAESAQKYLQQVMNDHPGTPWALLAKRELERPLGWRWEEAQTPIEPPSNQVVTNNRRRNRTPRDDQARALPRPRQRRPPPKL